MIGRFTNKQQVEVAMVLLNHRGPDQEGVWEADSVCFGHKRLSIIDLSTGGRQPMETAKGVIVFNGEIYNYLELRKELEQDYEFKTRTDTEVLLSGYEQWGIEKLLRKIRGMFAFCVYDKRSGTSYLARDHLGKKPLYFSQKESTFIFGSTLPSVISLLGGPPDISPDALGDYFLFKGISAPRTIMKGVLKLPPGHYLEVNKSGVYSEKAFWMPDFHGKCFKSFTESEERLDFLIKQAVKDRLQADVPIGAFLSGGLDSSLVVAVASKHFNATVKTFSAEFEDQRLNETQHSKSVAHLFSHDHTRLLIPKDISGLLPSIIYKLGEPLSDPAAIPTYILSQAAASSVKVVLTGDGGDELFAGYSSSKAAFLAEHAQVLPGARSGRLDNALRFLFQATDLKMFQSVRRISSMLKGQSGTYTYDPGGTKNFREMLHLFSPQFRDAFVQSDLRINQTWQASFGLGWVDRSLYVDLLTLLPSVFLVKTDTMTMAHGLEARCPFLDLRVVEAAASLPEHFKLNRLTSKFILKKIGSRYLPSDIWKRKKHSFSVPIDEWIRGCLSRYLKPILLSPSAKRRGIFNASMVEKALDAHLESRINLGQQIYSLLVLEIWFRIFVDKSMSPKYSLQEQL